MKAVVVEKLNLLFAQREEIIESFEEIHETVFNTESLEAKRDRLNEALSEVSELMTSSIRENAAFAQDQGDYQERFDTLSDKYTGIKEQIEQLEHKINEMKLRKIKAEEFMDLLRSQIKDQTGPIKEFDKDLFRKTVDHLTVFRDGEIKVTFKDGTEL